MQATGYRISHFARILPRHRQIDSWTSVLHIAFKYRKWVSESVLCTLILIEFRETPGELIEKDETCEVHESHKGGMYLV